MRGMNTRHRAPAQQTLVEGQTTSPAPLRVSAIVCCYTQRRWADLLAALESLRGQSLPPVEVLVVVDYCPPLLERLRCDVPWVTAIPNAGEQGLSGARSTGVQAAVGEVVALLDDDAVAAPDWLERFTREYADPDVIAVGGHTEPAWTVGRPRWFPREFDWVVGCSYLGLPAQRTSVRNVFGGNMSIRREPLIQLGGFHGELGKRGERPLGCEETELCIRAHARFPESKVLYQPLAVIRHRVPRERCSLGYFVRRCFHEGLSKAAVTRIAGRYLALTTERSYVCSVLPRGVLRGMSDAVRRRRSGGISRALAITSGLAVTFGGYVAGSVDPMLTNRRPRRLPSRRAQHVPTQRK